MISIDTQPDVAPRRAATAVLSITSTYVVVTVASIIWSCLALLVGGGFAVPIVLLLAQVVFLVPLLSRHRQARTVRIMAGLTVVASGLVLMFLGSYFFAGLVGREARPRG